MPTQLYLSPHLDDVALSCAARVLADIERGDRVVVATVFSEGDNTARAQQVYATRQAEDVAALELLGAEPHWLGFADAPYRRNHYRNFREIVLDWHPDDVDYDTQIAPHFTRLISELQPVTVFAPLGVGRHIDHCLTHKAVRSLNVPNVLFYEDRPYCFVQHALRMRLRELGQRIDADARPPDLAELDNESLLAEHTLDIHQWHWLDTYLPAGPDREACCRRFAECLRSPPGLPDRVARCELVHYPSPDINKILSAVTAYKTQFPDLFRDAADYCLATRIYSQRLGNDAGHVERYWRLT